MEERQDLISRRAAIDAVHKEFDGCLVWDESGEATANEIEIILSNLPSAQPTQPNTPNTLKSLDCIDRRTAIDGIVSFFGFSIEDEYGSAVKEVIMQLPSAQPERIRFADKDHVWIDGKQYISLQRFQKAVKEAQPEIIHCRNCVKCQYDTLFDKYWCNGREVREDFYCGDAVRKEK